MISSRHHYYIYYYRSNVKFFRAAANFVHIYESLIACNKPELQPRKRFQFAPSIKAKQHLKVRTAGGGRSAVNLKIRHYFAWYLNGVSHGGSLSFKSYYLYVDSYTTHLYIIYMYLYGVIHLCKYMKKYYHILFFIYFIFYIISERNVFDYTFSFAPQLIQPQLV